MPYADPKKKAEYARQWQTKNRDHVRAYREVNRERRSQAHAEWRKSHLEERAATQRKYRAKFPGASETRSRISNILKGRVKMASTPELLGCDWGAFCWWLEAQFKPGMTWENYGPVWEIDHVIPISWFDQEDFLWQHKAFHFSNTQPLFVSENRSKSNHYVVQ